MRGKSLLRLLFDGQVTTSWHSFQSMVVRAASGVLCAAVLGPVRLGPLLLMRTEQGVLHVQEPTQPPFLHGYKCLLGRLSKGSTLPRSSYYQADKLQDSISQVKHEISQGSCMKLQAQYLCS
jgi:hypothetical protein